MSSGFHKYFEYLTTHLTSLTPILYMYTIGCDHSQLMTFLTHCIYWGYIKGYLLEHVPVATLLKKKMLFLSLAAIY